MATSGTRNKRFRFSLYGCGVWVDRCNAKIYVLALNRVTISCTVYVAEVNFRVRRTRGVSSMSEKTGLY